MSPRLLSVISLGTELHYLGYPSGDSCENLISSKLKQQLPSTYCGNTLCTYFTNEN